MEVVVEVSEVVVEVSEVEVEVSEVDVSPEGLSSFLAQESSRAKINAKKAAK